MYERLTERNANGTAKSLKSPKSSYMGTVYEEMAEIQTEILNRLCDLEDKIEKGKLLELPCSVGQTVYCIRYDKARKPFVKPLGVCSVTVWGKGGLTVFTTKEDSWGVTAFATTEEAEAKLREMEEMAREKYRQENASKTDKDREIEQAFAEFRARCGIESEDTE